MNYFVEGLQGSGKNTMVQKLSEKYPEFIEEEYKNIDPEGQEKRRIEQEERARKEQQRIAAEKSYIDEISKILMEDKAQIEEEINRE